MLFSFGMLARVLALSVVLGGVQAAPVPASDDPAPAPDAVVTDAPSTPDAAETPSPPSEAASEAPFTPAAPDAKDAAPSSSEPARTAELACLREAAERVQAHYDQVRDLTAAFEQTTRSVSLGSTGALPAAPVTGRVTFAKPGKMRWAYEQPQRSLVVSDGQVLWLYDEELAEAQRLPVTDGFLSGAAMQFLLGDGRLVDEFRIGGGPCEAERVRLDLTPLRDATYERLELVADPRSGVIAETAVADLFGNVTRVVFRDLVTNQQPDPALFRFEPPEGVRVLEIPVAAP